MPSTPEKSDTRRSSRPRIRRRYLVVAHQTAESPELSEKLLDLASGDENAEFALIVPATPIEHIAVWSEGETIALASRRAAQARARWQERGLRVVSADVGDASPLLAIMDAFDAGGDYDAVVISTLSPGVSRWLHVDVVSRARRQLNVPVHHVIAVVAEVPAATR